MAVLHRNMSARPPERPAGLPTIHGLQSAERRELELNCLRHLLQRLAHRPRVAGSSLPTKGRRPAPFIRFWVILAQGQLRPAWRWDGRSGCRENGPWLGPREGGVAVLVDAYRCPKAGRGLLACRRANLPRLSPSVSRPNPELARRGGRGVSGPPASGSIPVKARVTGVQMPLSWRHSFAFIPADGLPFADRP